MPRLYRSLEARRGNFTAEFWKETAEMMNSTNLFSLIPSRQQNLRARALTFSALGRCQGSVWYFLNNTWHQYPFALFDLLDDELSLEQVVHRILNIECSEMFDEFTEEFLMMYPTDAKLSGNEARLVLLMIIIKHSLSMHRIECRHAAIRRNLRVRGTTHGADIDAASSDWILMRQRALEVEAARRKPPSAEPSFPDEDAITPSRCAATGPCRAWMSELLS